MVRKGCQMKDAFLQFWQFLGDSSWHDAYSKNMRSYLFSGFFTLSGFLLSAHTFIVIHMKKEIYDTDKYRQRVIERRGVTRGHTHYGALTRLSLLLIGSVAMALVTSILQFTVGLYPANWAVLICTGMAAITAAALLGSLVAIWGNIKAWLKDIEDDSPVNAPATTTDTTSSSN